MDIIKVLFIWEVRAELQDYLWEKLKHYSNIELIFPETESESEYLVYAPEADIMVGWRPTSDLLKAATKMKLFINPGAGVQHLIDLFKEIKVYREITLVNGHGNSYFTAQHAVAILLTLMNKIIPHHNWMVEGYWRRGDAYGKSIPLRNKTVGLFGFGSVNRYVYRFLSGFEVGFRVLKRSIVGVKDIPEGVAVYPAEQLHNFLQGTDVLIIAAPLTEETEGIIGEPELKLLGPTGILVNIGRGSIVQEGALFNALETRTVAGAAIDVWYEYNPEPDDIGRRYPYQYPFQDLDNVVLSPHRAASPMDDLRRWDEVVENIVRFVRGKQDFLNLVSLERGY